MKKCTSMTSKQGKIALKWKRWKRKLKHSPSVKSLRFGVMMTSNAEKYKRKKNDVIFPEAVESNLATEELGSANRNEEQSTSHDNIPVAVTLDAFNFTDSQDQSSKNTSGFGSSFEDFHSNPLSDNSLRLTENAARPRQSQEASCKQKPDMFYGPQTQSEPITRNAELCENILSDTFSRVGLSDWTSEIFLRRSDNTDGIYTDVSNLIDYDNSQEASLQSLRYAQDISQSSGFASDNIASHNGPPDEKTHCDVANEHLFQDDLENHSRIPHKVTATSVLEMDHNIVTHKATEVSNIQDLPYSTSCNEMYVLATTVKEQKKSQRSNNLDLTNVNSNLLREQAESFNQEFVDTERVQDCSSTNCTGNSSTELHAGESILCHSYSSTASLSLNEIESINLWSTDINPSLENHTQNTEEQYLDQHLNDATFNNTGFCNHGKSLLNIGKQNNESCPAESSDISTLLCEADDSLSAETSPQKRESPLQHTETPPQLKEIPSQQTETPSQQTETSFKHTEISSQLKETPSQHAEKLSQNTELQSKHTQAQSQHTEKQPKHTRRPSLHTETQHRDTEIPSKHTKTQRKHTEIPPQHTDIPLQQIEAPSQDTETQPKHTETPPQHTETPPQHTDIPLQQIEAPSQDTETHPKHTETPLQHTETPPQHTETPPQHTDIPLQQIEAPSQDTETQPKHTETLLQHTETPPQHTETPHQHTDIPLQQIEAPSQDKETQPKHTETPLQHTETPPQHTETPHQHTDIPPQQIEAPSQDTETQPKHTETPSQHIEIPPQQTTTPSQDKETQLKHTETPSQHTEIPPQQTDTQPQQTEISASADKGEQRTVQTKHFYSCEDFHSCVQIPTSPSHNFPDAMHNQQPGDNLCNSGTRQCSGADCKRCSPHHPNQLECTSVKYVCSSSELCQRPNHSLSCSEETMRKDVIAAEPVPDTATSRVSSATAPLQKEDSLLPNCQQTTSQEVTENEILQADDIQEVLTSSSSESASSIASDQEAAEQQDEGEREQVPENEVHQIDNEHLNMIGLNIRNEEQGELNQDVVVNPGETVVLFESDDRLYDIQLGDHLQDDVLHDIQLGAQIQNDVFHDLQLGDHMQDLWPPWPIPTDIDFHRIGDYNFDQERDIDRRSENRRRGEERSRSSRP